MKKGHHLIVRNYCNSCAAKVTVSHDDAVQVLIKHKEFDRCLMI